MKALVIVGPTASGKSGLAVRLAAAFDGEVISADSRQVYRGLTIGTGKITKAEMKGVPHHLLDVASPKRVFSAADFVRHAQRAMKDITKRGKLPIIAGGTGFYIDALFGRIALPDVPPDPEFRTRMSTKSAAQLFTLLTRKDPVRAHMMDTPSERNNKVRLIRALEIAAFTKRISAIKKKPMHRDQNPASSADVLWIGISPSQTVLDKKIQKRLKDRIAAGMIAEAKRLKKSGLSVKRMRALGLEYRSLADHLEQKISKDEMIAILSSEIRRYARKQTGYWNRNESIEWFDPKEFSAIAKRVQRWLAR